MKIASIEVFALRVPPEDGKIEVEWGMDCSLVKVTTDTGIVGWGETDSNPAIIKTIFDMPTSHYLSYSLKDLLIGENPLDIERLWNKMYLKTLHYGRSGVAIHAISAIDIALWDIAGKFYNVPVYQLLGGKYRDKIKTYGTFIPVEDIDTTVEYAKRALEDGGFDTLKFGGEPFGLNEKYDIEVVRRLREALGDDIGLAADVSKIWPDYGTALSRMKKLEQYNLEWVEEPCLATDYDSYKRLASQVKTKISGGEALATVREFNDFMRIAQPSIVQPDVTNCGGITEMKRINMLAELNSCKLIPHNYGSGILLAATIHCLASFQHGDTMEYSNSMSPFFRELDRNLVRSIDGYVTVPDRPGLGVDIDEDVIKKYTYTW